jgi:hypothetical protein
MWNFSSTQGKAFSRAKCPLQQASSGASCQLCALPWLYAKYQKGHTGTWLQPQAKLLKNVSTIGQSAKKRF